VKFSITVKDAYVICAGL